MKPPLFTFMFASIESSSSLLFPVHCYFFYLFILVRSQNQLSISGVLLNDYGLLFKKHAQ